MNKHLLRLLANQLEALDSKKFDIGQWQTPNITVVGNFPVTANDYKYAKNQNDFHTCGNTACIGGYAALLPEWQDAGLKPAPNGSPLCNKHGTTLTGSAAFAAVAEIHIDLASAIVLDVNYPDEVQDATDGHDRLQRAVMGNCNGYQYDPTNAAIIQSALCSIVGKKWYKWDQADAAKILNFIVDLRIKCEWEANQ